MSRLPWCPDCRVSGLPWFYCRRQPPWIAGKKCRLTPPDSRHWSHLRVPHLNTCLLPSTACALWTSRRQEALVATLVAAGASPQLFCWNNAEQCTVQCQQLYAPRNNISEIRKLCLSLSQQTTMHLSGAATLKSNRGQHLPL